MTPKRLGTWRAVAIVGLLSTLGALQWSTPGAAQDWFRTGTGLGVSKPTVAVADLASRSGDSATTASLFSEVVRNDLDYSGIINLASKSFYPTQVPSVPGELNYQAWSDAPVSAQFLAFGNATVTGTTEEIQAWFYDVKNSSAPAVVGRVYHGDATEEQTRRFAHQFADEIIARLSGGVPGVASHANRFRQRPQRQQGNLGHGLRRRQSASAHFPALHRAHAALVAGRHPYRLHLLSHRRSDPQRADLHILDVTSRLLTWAHYPGTNSAPAWSPDGTKIMFMSSMYGNPELFVAEADGTRPRRVTHSTGANTSAACNPKTGQQVAFVSDRGGIPQLYTMDADGSDLTKIPLPDMGYVIDPAWSPNGQLLAFSWRRPNGNYDIYVMDIASHALVELTRDAGRNERPSWAPDGRHLVFESTRTGTRQIWSMLADGTSPRELTAQGQNESPNWSPK